ncbi:armadillo-type protein [Crucibulum laeve]|uniref:Pumilio homology domain family member 3 n=1 Tax=Crucibulum laeve TaxID=68775 RepID=A0A5C3MD22_9AGAR|nr:armadillo-type protein [Crucibulum laeve]
MPRSRTYPPVRSSPSPNRQVYGSGVEYTPHSPATRGPGTRSNRRDANAPPIQIRSAILDEFRGDKTRKWELNDIKGFIVEFSCDQHGSRFIQQKLESASSEERQAIFDEIAPNYTLRLMQDVFGNYVIQKVFEFGTQAQKDILATAMEGHVLQLTLQVYGCRVVQKAVEHVLPEQQSVFVREIEPHVLRCVKDSNGNHVIQKMVQCVPAERLGFIKSFRGSVRELATHPYGCRVLQRCLEHITEDLIRPIREELHSIANKLMVDQFGNYVVQFLLEHGKPQDKALVVVKLRGQLLYLARHKFASNVCERALLSADIDSRRMLIDEIMMNRPGDGFNLITALMRDQYGNYVLQRALTVSEGEQREVLFAKVRAEVAQMRRFASSHSKHLISSTFSRDSRANIILNLLQQLNVFLRNTLKWVAVHK